MMVLLGYLGCSHVEEFSFSGFSVGCCIERRLSVTNFSSENNFANVSTECSSHQGESERSAKQRCYL